MATLADIVAWMNDRREALSGVEHTVLFDLKGDGFIHVAREGATPEQKPADLTIRISLADLVAIGERKLDPFKAFMTGRVKLSSMTTALKMKPLLTALFS